MKKLAWLLLSFMVLFSCTKKEKKEVAAEKTQSEKADSEQNANSGWDVIRSSVVTFDSYDGERILESGQGFFISENMIVTLYSLVNKATRIVFTPLNENTKFEASKYVAVDRINDIIILYCDNVKRQPLGLFTDTVPRSAKSMYISTNPSKAVQLFSGKVLNLATVKGTKLFRITNRVNKSNFGMPLFVSNKQVFGVGFSAVADYEMQSFAIPAEYILKAFNGRNKIPATLESLNSGTSDAVSAENSRIKGLVLETDYGNITIRLFNETPEYRDNFIKLTKEHFYDSLLIHRVIKDFGIQSGAADSRYARKGDNVGFKGPGYTLPAHFVPSLFHKRGMIGSPRKPDTKNERLRSDGSQFYIVSGRKYNDAELDEIEKQNNYKFSSAQRSTYKSVGGAPHLDGSYTIFGEVISGMDVVDKIVVVETDRQWRPLENIWLRKITILK